MPREIVLGNGRLLITLDADLRVRDVYFPHVGATNNALGCRSSLGVWVQGEFAWLDGDAWAKKVGYKPGTLAGSSLVTSERLGISLTIEEAVHPRLNIYLRCLRIKNLDQAPRDVRLFVHSSLAIGGTDVGDTAFYDPESRGMCHFKKDIYFLINGLLDGRGIHQYTVQKRFAGFEGNRSDAEDGELHWRPVDQGAVDSLVSLAASFEPKGEKMFCTWLVAGRSLEEVRQLDRLVKERTPEFLLRETETYWENWLARAPETKGLPADLSSFFRFSLLVIRTQVDSNGAVLASPDTDIMATNRDHYAYVWPRDGALVAAVLDRAGYGEVARAFYQFCAAAISEHGYFWHKYHADGTIGSTWLARIAGGREQLPIQEDETALVIWALWRHYLIYRDMEFVASLYDSLVRPAADFMTLYRDANTGLPLPSYDLWEERRGVFTCTTAAVAAGLDAAGKIALMLGDATAGNRWLEAAQEVKEALVEKLYVRDVGRFIRGLTCDAASNLVPDYTLDASLCGVFAFDVLPADDPRVTGTMRAIEEGLWARTEVGGVARYVNNDYYFRRSDDVQTVPGNPWFITTLWLAEWYAAARTARELGRARELLYWAYGLRSPAGMLAEQVHPYTGEPLSVSPLTWSHAAYCQVILRYIDRLALPELATGN